MARISSWLEHDARHRFGFSLGFAAAAGLMLHTRCQIGTLIVLTWNVFALCVLALAWLTILTTPENQLRRRAQEQDLSRVLISVFLIVAAASALFGVIYLLHSSKTQEHPRVVLHSLMTLFAVAAAWSLTHTVFGMRYAHAYYGDEDPRGSEPAGGLEFPGKCAPNYLDFAYFSFVIGMTFQVSDVQVTSRDMRQLVLLHGVVSFAFNTAILALAITAISSLL